MGINSHIDGTPWRISKTLGASMSSVPLLVPEPNRVALNNTARNRDGITILGFSYNIVTTSTNGITIQSLDPAHIEGTTTTLTIWSFAPGAAGTYQHTVSPCFIPLSHAHYIPTPSDGATLAVSTGASVTGGFLLMWGVYGQVDVSGKQAFSGSPWSF